MSRNSLPNTSRAGRPNGRRQSRWLKRLPLLVATAAVVMFASVQAFHLDGFFELDRDAISSTSINGDDWEAVYNGNSSAIATAFVEDGEGPTIYTTGGSKDDLDISSWRHKDGSTPDKDELLNAYAARYGSNIYFGADRTANNGDAVMGFWFFQNPVGLNPNGTFSGVHKDGDVLVLSDFSGGGGNVTVRVYRWNGPGGDLPAPGPGDPPLINGTLQLLAGTANSSADCVGPPPIPSNGSFCGTVNTAVITAPWPFDPKVGPPGSFQIGEFYEGGIDLTFLGLQNECFASFLAETRASTSVDSTLKDFVIGEFQPCDADLVTTPKLADGVTTVTSTSITTAGSIQVKDSAMLTISGVQNWSGSLTFSLCGPADLPTPTSTCTTGGTSLAPVPVTNATPNPIVSPAATITSAGRYCWRADFTATTQGVPPKSDSAVGECFVVTPVTPTVTTSAQGTNGAPVSLGTALFDNAIVGPVANKPGSPVINPTQAGGFAGGSVTFSLYGPFTSANPGTSACTVVNRLGFITVPLTGTAGTGSGTATSGTAPAAGNGTFTPSQAGFYAWVAFYTTAAAGETGGLNPNTNSGPANGCGDTNEVIEVTPLQPGITTDASADPPTGIALGSAISDSATLTGTAPNAGGSITFRAYGPDNATCSGTAAFTATVTVSQNASGSGTYNSGNFTPTQPGTYRWVASYSGDLPNTLAVSGACNDLGEASLVVSVSMTTSQWFLPNDSATITASGGGALAGSVRFRVWVNDATCTEGAHLYDSGAINVTTGTGTDLSKTVETSNVDPAKRVTVNGATGMPVVYWRVQYTSTNPAHPNAESPCGRERTTLNINNNFVAP